MKGTARGLQIFLGETLVGHLISYSTGANVFYFADSYLALGANRMPLGMHFTGSGIGEARMGTPYVSRQKLPPFFSNLLPEGALREYLAKSLKTHPENEFELLAHLGSNLPGAVVARQAQQIPPELLEDHVGRRHELTHNEALPFSLGGAQLKFSMFQRAGRYYLAGGAGQEYIIKPPHPVHPGVPVNEYSAMRLAQAAGLDVPEVHLIPLSALDPSVLKRFSFRTDERHAYAIRRFDRTESGRVHAEDFAQVLNVYPHEEYTATNYDTVLRILARLPDAEHNIREMIGRLVVNALLANGDAHLKNMGLIYPDGHTPRLSPLYDVLVTSPYISAQESAALNLGGTRRFQDYNRELFARVARNTGIDETLIVDALEATIKQAEEAWPALLDDLNLPAFLSNTLSAHWQTLHPSILPQGLQESMAGLRPPRR